MSTSSSNNFMSPICVSIDNPFFLAEQREPPGEFSSELRILTGQLALFRYKVSCSANDPYAMRAISSSR